MKRYSHLALLILPAFAGPTITQAADWYVRADAAGDKSGQDWTNAFAELPSQLRRGDVYYIADGTYGGYRFSVAESGNMEVTIKKATRSDHGSSVGWADTYGDGTATFTGPFTLDTSHFVLDGSTGGGPGSWKSGHGFRFTTPAGTSTDYIWIASNVSNVTVEHVRFDQTGNTEITTARANGIYNSGQLYDSTFQYNYFENLGGLPWLLRGGARNIFQYNYTGNVCGMSVADANQHCEVIVIHDMDDVHFRWNYISESPSSGGFVKNNTQNSDSVRIYGNVFSNGFPINCNTGSCSNWKVFNNTFHSNRGGPIGGDGSVSGSHFYNNISINFSSMATLWGQHDYNWFSRCSGVRCSMGAAANENICRACNGGCDSVEERLDPFVNSNGTSPEDFTLRAEIDGHAGYDVCRIDSCAGENKYNIDAFGSTRGSDGTWDMGAYEFGGLSGIVAPEAPTDLTVTSD